MIIIPILVTAIFIVETIYKIIGYNKAMAKLKYLQKERERVCKMYDDAHADYLEGKISHEQYHSIFVRCMARLDTLGERIKKLDTEYSIHK